MKVFSLTIFMILLFSGFSVVSQTADVSEIDLQDPDFRQKYENTDFKGNFSVQVLKDNTNNYFLVDFSAFKDKYEKVYFLSLVFQNGKVVNLDSDLSRNKIWFLSHISNTTEDINDLFIKLKEKTLEKSKMLSEEQKTKWLLENDKYK